MLWLVLIAVVMWLLQLFLGLWQMKRFNVSFKELRKKGRVVIGKKKGRFRAGVVVLLCIDENAKIISGRKMQGMTIFAAPREFSDLDGKMLEEISEMELRGFDKTVRGAILDGIQNYRSFNAQKKAEKDG
jgi:DNA-binding transcriptional regulator of glucitol operon